MFRLKINIVYLLISFTIVCTCKLAIGQDEVEVQKPFLWPSDPPSDCPFYLSKDFFGIVITGKYTNYTSTENWIPSWAADGNLYSPFTDGRVGKIHVVSGYNCGFYGAKIPKSGYAVIAGDDPMNLRMLSSGTLKNEPWPYTGRYPCGNLAYNGIWYYGTYGLDWEKNDWDILGPLIGFHISRDAGESWELCTLKPSNPLFGESGKNGQPVKAFPQYNPYTKDEYTVSGIPGQKVKIGNVQFVDFGKNMEFSPDGKAYLLSHGSTRPEALNSWIAGDQIYMLRVTPTPENINDPKKYEFFAGFKKNGQAIWSKKISEIKPLIEWDNHLGWASMTYNAPLKKYILCITDGGEREYLSNKTFNTFILESDEITGPFKLISYMKDFGTQAYFVNIPSKFISNDGHKAWLLYTAAWKYTKENPIGSTYSMSWHEIELAGMESEYAKTIFPPVFHPSKKYIEPTQQIKISSHTPGTEIRYTTDGTIPNKNSTLYSQPFTLSKSATVKAVVYKNGLIPDTSEIHYEVHKMAFQSKNKSFGENPENFDVSLDEVKKIIFWVDDVDDYQDYDHSDWADLKLTKKDGEVINISELTPLSSTQGWGNLAVNRSIAGKQIMLKGNKYKRGLGMHAPAEVIYELTESFTKITGMVGIDDATQGKGSSFARFIIITE